MNPTNNRDKRRCYDCKNYVQSGFKDWSPERWDPGKQKMVRREPSKQYVLVPRCGKAAEASREGIVLHPSRDSVCATHFEPR